MSAPRNSRGQFATKRQPPPPLEYRNPDCPMCHKEVSHDGDGFVCYGCEAWWSSEYGGCDEPGNWNAPDEIACPSAIKPYDRPDLSPEHESIRHLIERCILPDDHGGKHRAMDSWHKWDDEDPRVTTGRDA